MGLTGERHFQNSCEVYLRGSPFRRTLYGITREEVLHPSNLGFLAGMIGRSLDNVEWGDIVVTKTKRIRLGLGPAWTRVARRRNEYGDLE